MHRYALRGGWACPSPPLRTGTFIFTVFVIIAVICLAMKKNILPAVYITLGMICLAYGPFFWCKTFKKS